MHAVVARALRKQAHPAMPTRRIRNVALASMGTIARYPCEITVSLDVRPHSDANYSTHTR